MRQAGFFDVDRRLEAIFGQGRSAGDDQDDGAVGGVPQLHRGTTVFVRDARGLLTQSTDGRGVTTQFAHDAAGRVLTKAFPATPAETVAYSYDATADDGDAGRADGSRADL